MRLVRYSPQERVDLPDITAMSFLPLGEFRRAVRGLVIGPNAASPPTHDNFIIRGFAAEPSGVPDAIVTVRLVPTTGGGRPLGFAIGAEDLTARIDFGQLIGGEDQAGNTEGNATATFDFTGQPLATYRLQLRFTYQEGVNDNRAFWDAATNTEFIAAEDTRFLPAYALGISVSPGSLGDAWIPIADVVWDGASIDGADITDIRTFLFEGAAPFGDSAQDTYAAIPDFDRSDTRATDGLNEIYPALRALARQIVDIKGQDSSGDFNWYARTHAPFSDTNSALAVEQTKSLATVDVTTYTIGDGVSTFGDFNGASGLETCLQHLEDLAAQNPEHVRIVLKANAAAFFTWNITTQHFITNIGRLEIIGRGGSPSGRTRIDISTVPGTGSALSMTTGDLYLENLDTGGAAPTNDIAAFGTNSGGAIVVNCRIDGSDQGTFGAAVFGDSNKTRILNSVINGRIFINGLPITSTPDSKAEGALIENCEVNGAIELEHSGIDDIATGLTVRNSEIRLDDTSGFGLRGAIDVGAAQFVRVENSTIRFVFDFDGIHALEDGTREPTDITIVDTLFVSSSTSGSHAAGAGANGADGTGWGIFVGTAGTNSAVGRIRADGCRFSMVSVDAGGIFVENSRDTRVSNCVWRGCRGDAAGTDTFVGLYIRQDGTALDGQMDNPCQVTGCQFGPWGTTFNTRTKAIEVDNILRGLEISCSTFLGNDEATAPNEITGRVAGAGSAITGDVTSRNISITGCHFARWEPDTALSRTIVLDGCQEVAVSGSTFHDCGGFPVSISSGFSEVISVTGNTIRQTGTLGNGIDVSASSEIAVTGNVVLLDGGVSRPVADFTGAAGDLVVGNRFGGGVVGTIIGAPALNANNI
jgi:hypothetical protein